MFFLLVEKAAAPVPDLVGVADQGLRVGPHELHLGLDLAGSKTVVGVEKGKKFAPGRGHAEISRRRHSGVFLPEIAYPVHTLSQGGGGIVFGTVIDHDYLEVGKGLGQNRIHRAGQPFSPIMGGDDYRDLGHFNRLKG